VETGFVFINQENFRTRLTLRNIAITAPYVHDGRFANLEEERGIEYADVSGGVKRSVGGSEKNNKIFNIFISK